MCRTAASSRSAETDGHRQMHLWRLELTDLMDAERRLVGHDPSTTSPQAPAGEVVLEVGHPLREAEDAAVDPQPVAGGDVMRLRLV